MGSDLVIDAETIRTALITHKPALVAVYQGDELARTIRIGPNKNRWQAALDIVAKLSWTTLELRSKAGDVLAVVGPAPEPEPEPELAASSDRDERLLGLMIRAQREALGYRERESAAALTACVSFVREMAASVATLGELQRMQLEALRTTQVPHRAVEVAPDQGLMSNKMLEQLAPILLSKLLAPTAPAAAPAAPAAPNGHATPTPQG